MYFRRLCLLIGRRCSLRAAYCTIMAALVKWYANNQKLLSSLKQARPPSSNLLTSVWLVQNEAARSLNLYTVSDVTKTSTCIGTQCRQPVLPPQHQVSLQ